MAYKAVWGIGMGKVASLQQVRLVTAPCLQSSMIFSQLHVPYTILVESHPQLLATCNSTWTSYSGRPLRRGTWGLLCVLYL